MFHKINGERAGGKEVIFAALSKTGHRSGSHNWIFQHIGGVTRFESPNAKYVDRFGMANGLPIDDPNSGYDPNNPWENREPRFYYNITLDGERIVQNVSDARAFAQLYVGGRDRNVDNSTTGYGHKKYFELTANEIDNGWSPLNAYQTTCPRFRLAEIYLFYAEAVNEAYGPNGSYPGASLSAVDAVNIVRDRAGVPGIDAKYTSDKETFRNIIRDERAVELAFEMKRWYDIRRWYIAHLDENKKLWALDFDKDHTYFTYRVERERIFDMKHYWMPFPNDQVFLYEDWKQNPGW
jgi:hypothetical protein